ncbi:BT0820 family HAD-type phosphatase [Flavicella marina]|uniref:BT0820 family HAD-type phosphatase n=1 Tax=Flavicella marina TaxID=1475951 RepID=UPI001263F160|nr:hydrolase [Flavicella marina]
MSYHNTSIIAVDFDGTIVENAYPKIGKPIMFAFETMSALQKQGHRLILWTVRSGKSLEEAVNFCKKNGIEFYAVNKNYPEENLDQHTSRKINADYFIDDRNIGGLVSWGAVHQIFMGTETPKKTKPKGLFSFFKK